MNDLTNLALNLPVLVLVICRSGAILMTAPVLSGTSVPARVRVALAALLSLIMYPIAMQYSGPLPTGVLAYAPLVLREMGMGLMMGFAGAVAIASLEAAGGLIAQQVGLTLVEMSNPDREEEESDQVTVFYGIFALLLFLAVDGHHWFIQALALSYREVPLGQAEFGPRLAELFNGQVDGLFTIALRVAAPVMAIMFMVNVVVALMAKSVPQMNILMVGYPVKVMIGVVAMALTFPLILPVARDAFAGLHRDLLTIVRVL